MATRTTVASDDGFPWKLVGAVLGVITISHALRGGKVKPLDGIGAVLAILAFFAE